MSELLLRNGADVAAADVDNIRPLSAAAVGGHGQIVKLLQNEADVDLRCGWYRTALIAASDGGHLATMEMLLLYKANINAEGDVIGTALEAEAANGDYKTSVFLLERGASIGASTFEVAARSGNLEVCDSW